MGLVHCGICGTGLLEMIIWNAIYSIKYYFDNFFIEVFFLGCNWWEVIICLDIGLLPTRQQATSESMMTQSNYAYMQHYKGEMSYLWLWNIHHIVIILMHECKAALSPMQQRWRYCNLTLSPLFLYMHVITLWFQNIDSYLNHRMTTGYGCRLRIIIMSADDLLM